MSQNPVIHSQSIESAGAGLFSKPSEFVKIMAVLLNDGVAAKTGNRILKSTSVQEMFTNQIPQFPDFARTPSISLNEEYSHSAPELFPQEGNPPQGWGLSWFLNTGAALPTGRAKNSGFWAGVSNVFYWVDPENGVTGMFATQILPSVDMNAAILAMQVEATVYAGLSTL